MYNRCHLIYAYKFVSLLKKIKKKRNIDGRQKNNNIKDDYYYNLTINPSKLEIYIKRYKSLQISYLCGTDKCK